MSDDKLKLVETCALLILMIEAREVPNVYLTNEVKLELKAPERRRLVELGLIETRVEGRRLYLSVTEEGWRRSLSTIGTDLPVRPGPAGVALYRLVATLRQFLQKARLAPADFFVPADAADHDAAETSAINDVSILIRKTYGELAPRPGAWVTLADLRRALGSLDRAEVDGTLVLLSREADVQIIPESNQKTLTAEQRAAAVSIGNQDKHLIAIGS